MLDKDVVKALEEHIENTKNIKYGARKVEVVNAELLKDTLDLINRQQKEIEEQDQAIINALHRMSEVRAEAIKEYVERLKRRLVLVGYVTFKELDDVAEEMTEGNDGK